MSIVWVHRFIMLIPRVICMFRLCQPGLSVTIKRLINLLQTLDMIIWALQIGLALISISELSMKVPTVPSIN